MTNNWSHQEGYLCWKDIPLHTGYMRIPFLALMLGDSKGLVKYASKGNSYMIWYHPEGYILLFSILIDNVRIVSDWDIV